MSQGNKGNSAPALNLIVDGLQTFWHHLFKSDVKKMIKNIYARTDEKGVGQQLEEDLKPIEHVHLFHSHDSQGVPQTTSVSVGGHYHKITTHDKDGNILMDSQGRPRVICSKPYRKVKTRKGKRMVTVEEEVKWGMADGQTVVDDHVHTFTYVKSKELSPDKMEQLKRQNAKAMLGAFEGGRPVAQGTEPPAITTKDTATIS